MQVLWLFSLGLCLTLAFMTTLWCFYFYRRNAGLVDIGWAFSFMITLGVSLYFGSAIPQVKLLLGLMVLPWALRLAWHLWDRFNILVEDLRYTQIRRNWGGDETGVKFLGMFLLQGLLVGFISIPFYIIASDREIGIGLYAWVGFTITILSFIGETVADCQLREFKKSLLSKIDVCDVGLWAYSRHPNYFFEWLVWVGIFIFCLDSPYGIIGIVAPLIMYYLLRHLSGIPMLEEHMLKTKKQAWLNYKKRVPVFFPRLW